MYFMFSGTAAASLFQEDLSRRIQCMLPSSAKSVDICWEIHDFFFRCSGMQPESQKERYPRILRLRPITGQNPHQTR